jgi:hypothetical protein
LLHDQILSSGYIWTGFRFEEGEKLLFLPEAGIYSVQGCISEGKNLFFLLTGQGMAVYRVSFLKGRETQPFPRGTENGSVQGFVSEGENLYILPGT